MLLIHSFHLQARIQRFQPKSTSN